MEHLTDFAANLLNMATKKEKELLDDRIVSISKKLQKLRKDAGYTSYENFALEKELPRVQYWRMEKGTNFQFKSLLQILDAHEMTLEEFFKGIK